MTPPCLLGDVLPEAWGGVPGSECLSEEKILRNLRVTLATHLTFRSPLQLILKLFESSRVGTGIWGVSLRSLYLGVGSSFPRPQVWE